ncbi:MAG: PEGA domain-containing protein [Methanolinea sp.]|nr:PEGA domain-containing protein [Methanolinea sp.]
MERPVFACIILCAFIALFAPVSADTGAAGDTGIYRFHGNVEGAEVYLDGQLAGVIRDGILDIPVNVTGPYYRTYTFQKEGYTTYRGVINSVPKKGQVIHIYVAMSAKPVVEYSTVHLMVTPTGGDVTWDGTSAGSVPPTGVLIIYNVKPGPHTLVITREGFETYQQSLFVPRNEVMKVPITLVPVMQGALSVESVPPGASVTVDGQLRGVTPLVIHDLPAGSHSVSLSSAGFQEYVSSVDVVGGDTARVSVSLVPATTSPATGRGGLPALLAPVALGLFIAFGFRRKG